MDKARAEAEVVRSLDAYRGGMLRGSIEQHDKKIQAAGAEFTALMKSHADSAGPFNGLLGLYQSEHRYREAFSVVDARLRERPDDQWATYQLGRTTSLSGERLEDGEAALRKYLEMGHFAPGATGAHAHYRLRSLFQD